jgi:hypothetical protein
MFGLAAVCREKIGNLQLGKFETQSIPMIAVGRCPNSNGLQFYNPENGSLVSSIDYNFNFIPPMGLIFTINIRLVPDLLPNCQRLIDTDQLFRGHAKFKTVYDSRNQVSVRNCVLCHISAHGLKSLVAPTLLKAHHNLDVSDRVIWNAAYNEEYDGLTALPTWEVIMESQ